MPRSLEPFFAPFLLCLLVSFSGSDPARPDTAPGPTSGEAAETTTEMTTEMTTGTPAWNQFRGPDRSGISSETGLLRQWPETGPKELWRRPLGEGFSGISVVGERFCTLFATGEEEFLACFRTQDGEELWRLPMGETFHEPFGNGPRATPTLEGGRVYALAAKGRLVAADLATGEELWRRELHQDYTIRDPQTYVPAMAQPGPQLPLYGYSGSPLVEGGRVIVETGAGHGKSIVAFDQDTGQEAWSTGDHEIGYSSPIAVTVAGERQILALPGRSIVALSPDGEMLWTHEWHLNPSQPIFVPPNRVMVSTIDDRGALLLEIHPPGHTPRVETVWQVRRLKNSWNSSIVYQGTVYGFDNATLRAVDLASGELLWAARGLGQGNLILADGLLFGLGDRGKLALVKPSPEGYHELGTAQVLEGRTWTPPTLADGVLYLRNHEEMLALAVR